MYLLFSLYFLTFVFLWKFATCRTHHPRFFFEKTISRWKKRKISGHVWKKIEKLTFFSQPGFFVKRLVNDIQIRKKIFIAGSPFSIKGFKTMKQFVVTSFSFFLFFYFLCFSVTKESLFWILVVCVFFFYLPDLYLQFEKEKREKILAQEVPYFIDLLSLTLESGLNIEQALEFVCQGKNQILTHLVRQKLSGLNYGMSLEKILLDLKEVIPNEEFKNFISSIVQAKKLGVSLSHSLEIQSELIRTRRKQKAEELSRTAAVKISLPLVLFIFPALLLLYIGPGILHLMR